MTASRRPWQKWTFATLVATVCLCSASFAAGRYVARADIREGRDLAVNRCTACHVVTDGQDISSVATEPTRRSTIRSFRTRSFQEVADDPAVSARSLRYDILNATPPGLKTAPAAMPPMALTDEQATVVIDYILSLRRR